MTGHEKMDKVGAELLGVVKRAYGPNIAAGMFDRFEEALKQVIKEAVEEERAVLLKIAEEERSKLDMLSRDRELGYVAALDFMIHRIRARSS